MLLSGDLGYIENAKLEGIMEKIQEVERMLKALIKSLEDKSLSKIPCTLTGNPCQRSRCLLRGTLESSNPGPLSPNPSSVAGYCGGWTNWEKNQKIIWVIL